MAKNLVMIKFIIPVNINNYLNTYQVITVSHLKALLLLSET